MNRQCLCERLHNCEIIVLKWHNLEWESGRPSQVAERGTARATSHQETWQQDGGLHHAGTNLQHSIRRLILALFLGQLCPLDGAFTTSRAAKEGALLFHWPCRVHSSQPLTRRLLFLNLWASFWDIQRGTVRSQMTWAKRYKDPFFKFLEAFLSM